MGGGGESVPPVPPSGSAHDLFLVYLEKYTHMKYQSSRSSSPHVIANVQVCYMHTHTHTQTKNDMHSGSYVMGAIK